MGIEDGMEGGYRATPLFLFSFILNFIIRSFARRLPFVVPKKTPFYSVIVFVDHGIYQTIHPQCVFVWRARFDAIFFFIIILFRLYLFHSFSDRFSCCSVDDGMVVCACPPRVCWWRIEPAQCQMRSWYVSYQSQHTMQRHSVFVLIVS